jgi:hypothetical protein
MIPFAAHSAHLSTPLYIARCDTGPLIVCHALLTLHSGLHY